SNSNINYHAEVIEFARQCIANLKQIYV
ncbi:unnamed protein product, partial [Didymodactylos carnosus]